MKKIALFAMMLLGMVSSAMAQEDAAADSLFVVNGYDVEAYAIKNGDYITFERPEWKTVVEGAKFYCYKDTIGLPVVYSDIQQLGNENKFRIKNFMGSGVDYGFRIQSADESLYYGDYTNLSGDVSTWSGSMEFDEDLTYPYTTEEGWNMEYFTPNGDYGWTVDGYSVNFASFANYKGYPFINFSQNFISSFIYAYTTDGRSFDGYWYGSWSSK